MMVARRWLGPLVEEFDPGLLDAGDGESAEVAEGKGIVEVVKSFSWSEVAIMVR